MRAGIVARTRYLPEKRGYRRRLAPCHPPLHNPGMLVLQAWRSWRNDKAVAFLASAAFAAGIGAATAIYTVVNAVMLKPLPYRDGDRFVVILSAEVDDPVHYGSLSFNDARTYQERTRVFDAFGWFRYAGKDLTRRSARRSPP